MSKEIVEKKEEKLTLFEMMDRIFDAERRKMEQIREQMNRSIFNLWNFDKQPVIRTGNIEDFQKSIEAYKKANPTAQVTARAYTFSSTNPEENKVFEYTEQEKLPEKKKSNKKKAKKAKGK